MSIADIEHTLYQPSQGGTRLILSAGDELKLTSERRTDVRTAVTRGLKEYIEQLSYIGEGGREIRFKKVLHTWAEPEVPAEYPSANVYAFESGTYDYSRMSPRTFDLPDGYAIRQVAEFVIPVVLEIWTTDPVERMNFMAMLEDAFEPVDWMYGMRLELPHYHNTRATYEKTAAAYTDSTEDAHRRWRRASISLNASITQFVRVGAMLPRLKTRIDLTANPEVVI